MSTKYFAMITSLPRLKEHREPHAGEMLPRLASDRREKVRISFVVLGHLQSILIFLI